MKKLSILFLSVLTLSLTLTSCSSDDNEASIVGKWEAYQEGTIVDGVEHLAPINNEGACDKEIVEYQQNGKYIDYYSEYNDSKCHNYTETGTWSKDDNKLTIKYTENADDDEIGEVLILDENTLKLKYTHINNGQVVEIYVIEFKRK